MANCCIRYTATSIFADFQAGCANFSYWVYWKISNDRWKRTGEGSRLGCEITEEEAAYLEKLAVAQWGPKGCEVIGRPVPAPAVKRTTTKRPKLDYTDPDQLSLF